MLHGAAGTPLPSTSLPLLTSTRACSPRLEPYSIRANTGIGYKTALEPTRAEAQVIVVARSESRGCAEDSEGGLRQRCSRSGESSLYEPGPGVAANRGDREGITGIGVGFASARVKRGDDEVARGVVYRARIDDRFDTTHTSE
ncbi:hypothetical protein ACHAWF_017402 [Thalassiosira exigua]